MEHVTLAAVGVNKAADYYTKADEVLPPPAPAWKPAGEEEATSVGDPTAVSAPAAAPAPANSAPTRSIPRRVATVPTTLDRLRQAEVALDLALQKCYERFRGGEITAREMERANDRLVAEFNQRVMSENIRYRSMLRKRKHLNR
jgi:hypothetical protein